MAAITSKDKEEPLELKQGGSKLFSRLFTRESSAAAPSFRVYYGVASAGSVPFMWESQPGTPKNDAISTAALPPLTPPPSYYTARQQTTRRHHKSATAAAAGGGGAKKHSRQYAVRIFSAILPKIILRRRSARSASSGSPSASSCSSSSSSSAFSSAASSAASSLSFRSAQSPAACSSMRSRVYAFSAGGDSEDDRPAAAPTCFSVRHESFRAFKGCRVAMTVKSALASVGGHGHGHGPAAATASPAAQKV